VDSSSNSNGSGTGSLPLNSPAGLALSTANLYAAVQPGGSLFGLQLSNPVDTDNAYKGPSSHFGTPNDPLVGRKVGGVNVFGGGLALYAAGRKIIGGVGLSGDTSCADHFIAWRLRNNLQLDHLAGVFAVSGDTNRPDNIVFDFVPPSGGPNGASTGGFGQPTCFNTGNPASLPAVQP
jgi:Haem degrading protein HbpS-like